MTLKTAWEVTDRLCSKRLQPFLPEMVKVLTRKGELKVTAEAESELARMSASTIDRILRRYAHGRKQRRFSTTKPGTLLKNAIPVRTFSEWDDKRPGYLEADLVAHCGESTEGFYLTTLSTVDAPYFAAYNPNPPSLQKQSNTDLSSQNFPKNLRLSH